MQKIESPAKKNPIILFSNEHISPVLLHQIIHMGFIPKTEPSLNGILFSIQYLSAYAVVHDIQNSTIDSLELVLNILDVDEMLPVIIVGKITDQRQKLIYEKMKSVFLIEDGIGQLVKLLNHLSPAPDRT
jgi:hypothetical protein